jgi:hypothetical protein
MDLIPRLREAVSDMLAGRARLVIGAIGVAVAVLVVMQMTSGVSTERPSDTPKDVDAAISDVNQALGGQLKTAEDEMARSALRTASIAMETLFAEGQGFAGTPASVARIEPNIIWRVSGANAAANEVNVTVDPQNAGYELSSTSSSGHTYKYARDAAGQVMRTCEPACGTW